MTRLHTRRDAGLRAVRREGGRRFGSLSDCRSAGPAVAGRLPLAAGSGLSPVVSVLGLLAAVTALVAHRASCPRRAGSSGPGIEPVSSAVAGRFLAAGPPGQSQVWILIPDLSSASFGTGEDKM